jgi:hypothetical protein
MTVADLLRRHSKLLSQFPKSRAPLPPTYKSAYLDFYKAAREGNHLGASIALRMEQWMHKKALLDEFPLLEIGAGTLNHVRFEKPFLAYDAVEPMAELYQDKPETARIRNIFADISQVSPSLHYRRIISIAVLEHVTNLPDLLARAAMLLEPDGTIISGIPSEGSLLWYLAWRFGSGTTFRLRYGLSYARFQRYEHVNNAGEIEALHRLIFEEVKLVRFPAPYLHLSLYTTIIASRPRLDVAQALVPR